MDAGLLPHLLVLWLLPCALQDWRSHRISNWLTVPAFLLAWPWALHTGTLGLTCAVFLGCWVAWRAGGMGAADGKIATVLAATAPAALWAGAVVLALTFAALRVQGKENTQVPAAVPLFLGAAIWSL